MKNCLPYALILTLCVSIQGCSGQTEDTEAQTAAQMQMELEVETLQEAEDEAEPESAGSETESESAKAEDARVNTIIGSLVDIDMEQITILSDNGNEVIMPIGEAELDFRGGFRPGNLVAVEYTGEITETDNREAEISVLRAFDSSDVETLTVSESRQETETESGDAAEETESAVEVKTLRGEIREVEWNSITITSDDGEELNFSTVNAEIYFTKGMSEGTKAVVSYTGEISGEDYEVISVMGAEDAG